MDPSELARKRKEILSSVVKNKAYKEYVRHIENARPEYINLLHLLSTLPEQEAARIEELNRQLKECEQNIKKVPKPKGHFVYPSDGALMVGAAVLVGVSYLVIDQIRKHKHKPQQTWVDRVDLKKQATFEPQR